MSTARELNQVFDIVEELVGIDPSTEDLTNAIHAVITKDSDRVLRFANGTNILMRVEDLARQYKTVKEIHLPKSNEESIKPLRDMLGSFFS